MLVTSIFTFSKMFQDYFFSESLKVGMRGEEFKNFAEKVKCVVLDLHLFSKFCLFNPIPQNILLQTCLSNYFMDENIRFSIKQI